MEKAISNTLESLLLPPGIFVVILMVGLLCLRAHRRLGAALIATAAALLYVISTPAISSLIIGVLEAYPALPAHGPLPVDKPTAIVILGGNRYDDAPEYGGDTLTAIPLDRVRYGARLARRTHAPILVTGGTRRGEHASGAELMQQVLEQDFSIPVKWVETESRTTWENAQFTNEILEPLGIRRIFLVTSAWHMSRSVYAFRHFGFDVVPAPASFNLTLTIDPDTVRWQPDPHALYTTSFALHEVLGRLWYQLKGAM